MPSPIERLRKASSLKTTKRSVTLSNGDTFEFWSTPLTMAERERAQKDAKSDDINLFALQLLVLKAKDDGGGRMFGPGDVAVLKNDVRDDDLQALMIAIMTEGEAEEEISMKRPGGGAKE